MPNETQEPLTEFRAKLRTENTRSLREQCQSLIASGIDYKNIARVIWDNISENSVADTSWLPAASCVNHTDCFWQVSIQRPEDQHKVICFGEPAPEFRRVEAPPPLEGAIDALKERLPILGASHDWLLTERCLLGIARQSDALTTLTCIVEQLLRVEYLGKRSGPWWSETRLVTARCMIEVWQCYGDEAIIPYACRYGARLCARQVGEPEEEKQDAMETLAGEYAKLGTRKSPSHPSIDEAAFRQQLSSDDPTTVFGGITDAWKQGASLEQIELAMTMHCVERLARAAHGDGANWHHLRNELMAVANISKLKAIDETLAIQSAYHAAYLILRTTNRGLVEEIPEVTAKAARDRDKQFETIISEVQQGNAPAAIDQTHNFIAGEHDGVELLRRLFLTVGYDNTYAGQRCMIEAWHRAENHPERDRILLAMVGWEARYRKRFQKPAKDQAQILAEQDSEANMFMDCFDGTQLSNQWRTHNPIVVRDGVLRFAPNNSNQLVTLRQNFTNFVLTVDLRIICETAGIIVRWKSPHEYYMVQVGTGLGDPKGDKVAWFHVFSPKYCGWQRDDLAGGRKPVEDKWYRLRLKVKDFKLTLSLHALDDDGSAGEALINELDWRDPDELFAAGAIGFWECPGENALGEQAEFRNLEVRPIANIERPTSKA